MEALSFDNILGENEIDTLFTDPTNEDSQEESSQAEEEKSPSSADENSKEKTTEVVDPDTMFEDETPESVGSGKNKEGKGEDRVTCKSVWIDILNLSSFRF